MKSKFLSFLVVSMLAFPLLYPLSASATITATLSTTLGEGVIEYINPIDSAIDRTTDTYYALLSDGTVTTYDDEGAELLSFSAVQTGGEEISGIAVHPTTKDIYVTSSTGVVKIYDDEGNYMSSYGDAAFTAAPTKVAVDANGSYVTNSDDGAVYFFNSSNVLVDTEIVQSPDFIEVQSGTVYVTEGGGSTIHSFTTAGVAITQLNSGYTLRAFAVLSNGMFAIGVGTRDERTIYIIDTDGQIVGGSQQDLNAVASAEITSNGYLVAGYESNADGRVEVFDMDEALSLYLIPRVPPVMLAAPSGIALADDGSVYVSDSGYHKVNIYNASGDFVSSFGNLGTGDGQFTTPVDIALDGDGNVYVADQDNTRIQVFSADGDYLDQWEVEEDGSSYLGPAGLAVWQQRVYVIGYMGDEQLVHVFSLDGSFEFSFGGYGSDPGQFLNTSEINIQSDGTVAVFDEGNGLRSVSRFTSEGVFISRSEEYIDDGTSSYPLITGIAFDANDNFYFSDNPGRRVFILNTEGITVGMLEYNEDEENLFNSPGAIAVSDDKLFVGDSNDGVVFVFSYVDDVQYGSDEEENEEESPNRSGSAPRRAQQPIAVPDSVDCKDGAFLVNLSRGSRSEEVRRLQDFLRGQNAYTGPTTGYFGPLTQAGVSRFQLLYHTDILAPLNLTAPTGNWYSMTRAKANELKECSV